MSLLVGCSADRARSGEPDGASQPSDGVSPTPSDAGWAALMDWDALPVLGQSRSAQSSSRERDGAATTPGLEPGNKDFNNFMAICGQRPQVVAGGSDGAECDPGIEGYVIASADDGPGFVSRLFMGAGNLNGHLDPSYLTTGFTVETIRIYVDDLSEPAFEGPVAELLDGSRAPFVPPLTREQSGSLVSYLPISYRSKMRIVLDHLRTDGETYYYQVDRRSVAATSAFDPRALAKALPDGVAELQAKASGMSRTTSWTDDDMTVPAGEAVALLDRDGPGAIRRFELTADVDALDDLVLQASWDDAELDVDAPLSDLFACKAGAASFDTLPMAVHVDGSQAVLTLTLPMPFASRAVVSVHNGGRRERAVHARVQGVGAVPGATWGYLHAVRNDRRMPADGERYQVIDVAGRGKYVGAAVRFAGHAYPATLIPDPFNFLEGDDTAVADGEAVRQGTGTEESFDGGWYFRSGPFSAPFSAVVSVGPGASADSGQITAVRWQVLTAAIDFQHSFDLSYEYGADVPSTVNEYTSVAFYYLK
jgi:hypothetical protein